MAEVVTILAAVGSGIIGGLFFAFSTSVMKALKTLPPVHGIAAMRSINIVILNPLFLGIFLGTAVACAASAVMAIWASTVDASAMYRLGASALYLGGAFLVTMVFNVPRNNALATAASGAEAEKVWQDYLSTWTAWNHVRTVAAIAAALLFTIALAVARLPIPLAAQISATPSKELPSVATAALRRSLEAAESHGTHIWRDTPPTTSDGDVNAYIEIPRGERRKWEFDMRANARAIDRLMPAEVGGYPVNYGFVPQTVSYDGDPFDVLVLGPPLPGGRIVRGRIVGLMIMEDEKGADSKVVVSPIGSNGEPSHQLTDAERNRIAEYFRRYKRHEPGAFSNVPGWGQASDGRAHVETTHAFFLRCRDHADAACHLD